LTAYFPWAGAKNKLLGGFAAERALLLFKIFILCQKKKKIANRG
jgi:hypothetical protein